MCQSRLESVLLNLKMVRRRLQTIADTYKEGCRHLRRLTLVKGTNAEMS
jgi:hypothetical protein